MGQVSFSLIPSNWRVPGAYAEVNNQFAVQGLVGQPYTVLIIGQALAAGTATAEVPVLMPNATQADKLFGQGSQLARMVKAYRDNDAFTKVVALPLDDDGAAAAATGTVAITGSATETGTLYLYVGGQRLKIGITTGDDATTIGDAIVTAVTAEGDLPVTASNTAGTVTLTAKNKGEAGNEIDIRTNYFSGEETPAGVTVTITDMSSGTGNPDIADAITAMADDWYNVIVCPWTDAANLTALEAELADRFGPMRAIDGVAVTAKNANHSALITLGDSRNSPHVSIFESFKYPRPPYERAAMIAAQIARSGQNDPARPFQTLALKGDMPQAESDRFTQAERNLLLFDGISTCTTDAGGLVRIERALTTYQENAFGSPDTSYLDLTTMLTLSYLRYTWRARVTQKFPRMKLADDPARGDNIMTPKRYKDEMIALAGDWFAAGLVEDLDQFKRDVVVVINDTDPNRLDCILPPNLVNQLRVQAARIDFRL